MNDKKLRRCKFCRKVLLDEKAPICKRCALEGRNKVRNVVFIALGTATTYLGVKNISNNSTDKDDNEDSEMN